MKKLISIALAAAMLAAVSVPAFAANPITKETEQTGTTIIKTSTKTGPDSRQAYVSAAGHRSVSDTESAVPAAEP